MLDMEKRSPRSVRELNDRHHKYINLNSTVQYNIVQYSKVQYSIVRYCTVQFIQNKQLLYFNINGKVLVATIFCT